MISYALGSKILQMGLLGLLQHMTRKTMASSAAKKKFFKSRLKSRLGHLLNNLHSKDFKDAAALSFSKRRIILLLPWHVTMQICQQKHELRGKTEA